MAANYLPDKHIFLDSGDVVFKLESCLRTMWQIAGPPETILCIGTDRSTGDALGPLIGTALTHYPALAPKVIGTLENPVHASNLDKVLKQMIFHHTRVLAIDASVGELEEVGKITVEKGALLPGSGVNKDLPGVGDYHITGTVNIGGFMEYFVLQNTRLFFVMQMSEVISLAILQSMMD